jgi:hypothetical protein
LGEIFLAFGIIRNRVFGNGNSGSEYRVTVVPRFDILQVLTNLSGRSNRFTLACKFFITLNVLDAVLCEFGVAHVSIPTGDVVVLFC